MRKYLNGEFYNNEKLEPSFRERIAQTHNTNPNNTYGYSPDTGDWNTPGGSDTDDHIFLLSIEEVIQYFGAEDEYRQKEPKVDDGYYIYINDKFNGNRIASKDKRMYGSWWWLRSPGGTPGYAAGVSGDGGVGLIGGGVDDEGGVRPALWINLKS